MITRNKLRRSMEYGGLFNRHQQMVYDPNQEGMLTYYNDKVQQIRDQLGEFDYGPTPSSDSG